MIGVCFSSPNYAKLTAEATERFSRHTGLKCIVIQTPQDANWLDKLNAPESLPAERCVLIDGDLWFVKDVDLERVFDEAPTCVHGVPDIGVAMQNVFAADCDTLMMDASWYINTGLVMWDNANPAHRAAFAQAKRLAVQRVKVNDFGEQSYLNCGIQSNCQIRLLPHQFSFMFYALRRRGIRPSRFGVADNLNDVYAIHAAAYPLSVKRTQLSRLIQNHRLQRRR